MALYRDVEIESLIACRKYISEPPKRDLRLVGAYWRNHMRLLSDEGDRNFSVFMRKNEDLHENFSVGLSYNPNDLRGEITLLRCNWPHGLYNDEFDFDPGNPHWDYHIHKASERAMDAGLKPDKYATKTSEYASYEDALHYFLKLISVKRADVDKHFPNRAQDILDFERR